MNFESATPPAREVEPETEVSSLEVLQRVFEEAKDDIAPEMRSPIQEALQRLEEGTDGLSQEQFNQRLAELHTIITESSGMTGGMSTENVSAKESH